MFDVVTEDLIGSALPAVPNDEIDPEPSTKEATSEKIVPQGAGVGLLPKVLFFGVILAIIFMFSRSRKATATKGFGASSEKSFA